jgi:Galactose oxidase, central domain
MRILFAILALGGCSSGPANIDVVLHVAAGQLPLAEADQVTFSLENASGGTLAIHRAAPGTLSLRLDPVGAGRGYRARLEGTFQGDVVAAGLSCPFDVAAGAPAPSVPLYLGQVGRFAVTGSPAVARQGAVAFPFGGAALVAGGSDGTNPLASTESYAPGNGQFAGGPDLGVPHLGAAWAPLGDGSPLVIGGTSLFPTVEALSDGKWTALPTLVPVGLTDTAAAALGDGSVLACGGRVGGGDPVDAAWIIGGAGGALSPQSPLNRARAGHTLTQSADAQSAALFVIGGVDVSGPVADVEIYDPVTSSFAAYGALLATPRSAHTATRLPSGRILVAGGLDAAGAPLASAEVLDPVARRFLTAEPLTTARGAASATLLPSGRVLVAGGTGADGAPTGSVEIFDPTLGDAGGFVPTQPLSSPRSGHSVVVLCDGTLLLVGGGAGAERYVPIP